MLTLVRLASSAHWLMLHYRPTSVKYPENETCSHMIACGSKKTKNKKSNIYLISPHVLLILGCANSPTVRQLFEHPAVPRQKLSDCAHYCANTPPPPKLLLSADE